MASCGGHRVAYPTGSRRTSCGGHRVAYPTGSRMASCGGRRVADPTGPRMASCGGFLQQFLHTLPQATICHSGELQQTRP